MKKNEIKVGGHYQAKVSNKITMVRVDLIREVVGYKGRESTVYDVTNLSTGRKTVFHSAAKFRAEANKITAANDEAERIRFQSGMATQEGEQGSDPTTALPVDSLPVGVLQTVQKNCKDKNSSAPTSNGTSPRGVGKVLSCFPGKKLVIDKTITPTAIPAVTVVSSASSPKPVGLAAKVKPQISNTSSHLIVMARAGTGKTTTGEEGLKTVRGLPTRIAPSPQQEAIWQAMLESKGSPSICFTAFGKDIATEVQSRLQRSGLDKVGCEGMTTHSMGFSAVRNTWRLRGGKDSLNKYVVQDYLAEILGKDAKTLKREKPVMVEAVDELVGLVKQTLSPTDSDALRSLARYYDVELTGVGAEVFDMVPRVLEKCMDPTTRGQIDFNDMIWLPVVHKLPLRRYDLGIVDESQDLNKCRQELVKMAFNRLMLIGDDRQCQPPGTMVSLAKKTGNRWHIAKLGKRVPIETLRSGMLLEGYSPKDAHTYSNRVLQDIQVRDYAGLMVEVELLNGLKTRYTPNHKCYANFGPLRDYHAVYLMRRGTQYRIGSCQINYKDAGNGLVNRLRQEGGEASWMLEIHETKYEARLREMEVSHQFNLPQIVFSNANTGYILDDEGVNRFWEFVGDNSEVGKVVLDYYGLEENYPIAVPRDQWQQSFKRPALFHACNLVTGMQMRTEEGAWVSATITREEYTGQVYSLKVSHDQLYMADGIVTHNSIFGFSGADDRSMENMEQDLTSSIRGCSKLPLTMTYRCGKAIVNEAQEYVPDFEAHPKNPEGFIGRARYPSYKNLSGTLVQLPDSESYVSKVRDGDRVVCRCNAPLVSQYFKFILSGIDATILGRDIATGLLKLVDKLKATSVPDLIKELEEWKELEIAKEMARKSPSESKVTGITDRATCIKSFAAGAQTVEKVKKNMDSAFADKRCPNCRKGFFKEAQTCYTCRVPLITPKGVQLSSIHKVKGLEANRVFFLKPQGIGPRRDKMRPHELVQEDNLEYVAITRAIHELWYVK